MDAVASRELAARWGHVLAHLMAGDPATARAAFDGGSLHDGLSVWACGGKRLAITRGTGPDQVEVASVPWAAIVREAAARCTPAARTRIARLDTLYGLVVQARHAASTRMLAAPTRDVMFTASDEVSRHSHRMTEIARAMNATARTTWLAGEPTVPVQLDLLTHLEGVPHV